MIAEYAMCSLCYVDSPSQRRDLQARGSGAGKCWAGCYINFGCWDVNSCIGRGTLVWLLGRMAEPEHLTGRSQELADHLQACTSSPEDQDRIRTTGDILPTQSLRYKELRRKVRWVTQLPGERYFTVKRVRHAIESLLAKNHFNLPGIPGFSQQDWLEDQSKKVAKLLQRARKTTVAAMADDAETQPWLEDYIYQTCD